MSNNKIEATGYRSPGPAHPQEKKKKRVFMWFFLAVQALFIIWIISGIASTGTLPDCGSSLTAQECSDAQAVGTGIGVMLIVGVWIAVDFLLAVVWAVVKFARR